MTPGDAPTFAREFARLTLVFDRKLSDAQSDELVGTYFEAMAEYALEDVRAAIYHTIRSATYFPRPAELLERIATIHRERQHAEWRLVREMQRGAPLALSAAAIPDEQRDENLRRVRALIQETADTMARRDAELRQQQEAERDRKRVDALRDAERFWGADGDV